MKELAIALCRVSTKRQLEDGNLDPQIERVNKAATFLNAEIIKRWEIAASSRKGKNIRRKDLLEMRELCRRNKRVKYLIVDEVDRFMRSINEYYWWKQEFQNIDQNGERQRCKCAHHFCDYSDYQFACSS